MFQSPISITIPSYGCIAFLTYGRRTLFTTLFKACLHSFVDKFTAIGNRLKRDIHCVDRNIFLTSDGGSIKAISFADWAINFLSKPKMQKNDFINLAN